jgi:hypothetical protein
MTRKICWSWGAAFSGSWTAAAKDLASTGTADEAAAPPGIPARHIAAAALAAVLCKSVRRDKGEKR